ncbi:hypothetical protein BaRGS_00007430, partial [Batillaria attramentaria]
MDCAFCWFLHRQGQKGNPSQQSASNLFLGTLAYDLFLVDIRSSSASGTEKEKKKKNCQFS